MVCWVLRALKRVCGNPLSSLAVAQPGLEELVPLSFRIPILPVSFLSSEITSYINKVLLLTLETKCLSFCPKLFCVCQSLQKIGLLFYVLNHKPFLLFWVSGRQNLVANELSFLNNSACSRGIVKTTERRAICFLRWNELDSFIFCGYNIYHQFWTSSSNEEETWKQKVVTKLICKECFLLF